MYFVRLSSTSYHEWKAEEILFRFQKAGNLIKAIPIILKEHHMCFASGHT